MAMAVLLLLAAELDSGQTNAPGDSLDLVAAVRTGDPAAVGRSLRRREALKHHDDDDGAMAVVAAAADGHTAAPEIIGALLAAGFSVDRIDAQGRTALLGWIARRTLAARSRGSLGSSGHPCPQQHTGGTWRWPACCCRPGLQPTIVMLE